MNAKQLLQPRYEVIADYPNSQHLLGVGEIIEPHPNGYFNYIHFPSYPHIFRKLEWFEKRKVEDMPQYVKYIGEKTYILIAERYSGVDNEYVKTVDEIGRTATLFTKDFTPSTETEYLQFKNKL